MRPFRARRPAPVYATGAAALLLALCAPGPAHARPPELFGAECRITVSGSEARAVCHNPYPGTDLVSLRVDCARWWDLDTTTVPVAAGPTRTVRLQGGCWKEVGAAWVTHTRAPSG